jgi:hypothetical protein
MVCDASTLLIPLMVGSIAGALLTLSGGNFLVEYIKEMIEDYLKKPLDNLVPISGFCLVIKKMTLVSALIFLFSEIFIVGYIAFEYESMIYLSYCFFFAAIIIILVNIIFIIPLIPALAKLKIS